MPVSSANTLLPKLCLPFSELNANSGHSSCNEPQIFLQVIEIIFFIIPKIDLNENKQQIHIIFNLSDAGSTN